MKRLLVTAAALVAAVGFMAPAHATGTASVVKEGPYGPVTFEDFGTCTNVWANLNSKTSYLVNKRARGGVYKVEVQLAGTATSVAGQSPGACNSGTDNGNTVKDGVNAKMKQSFFIEVSNGKFTPRAKCDDACATDYTFTGINTFVTTFFKATATWTFSATKPAHEVVTSSDKKLCEDKWVVDYDPTSGTITKSTGDIANSCAA